MDKKTQQFLYLFLALLTLVAGYFYLRYAYRVADSTPFTQEIVLIILGTLATVFITALLLNQQTVVEIEKEQSVKYLDLKARTYERLLDLLEQMSLAENFSPAEMTSLQFITHRLALVASPEVLDEYQNFLKVLDEITDDNSFSGDSRPLAAALGSLTIEIRRDLVGRASGGRYTEKQIAGMIASNSYRSSEMSED